MEAELRYYYGFNEYEKLLEKLNEFRELEYKGCYFEKTLQYDHPMEEYSFYNKKIDGRFRIRTSKNVETEETKAKISWKKRNKDTLEGKVNKEEEIEVDFKYEEYDKLIFLLENVIRMKQIESYERYRNVFASQEIEIVVDKYPFGIALEIENKSSIRSPEETILHWTQKLALKQEDAYRLSWDDKYTELCKEQNIEISKNVRFGIPMPKIEDKKEE